MSLDRKFLEAQLIYENKIADLEAKLAESEKKFNVANNLRKNSDEVLLNYKTEKYGLDKTIQELRKMKLSLPEKEWYYKGFENCERQMSSHIADLTLEVKQLKQQLAEKDKKQKRTNKVVKQFQQRLKYWQEQDQDKISFAVDKLVGVQKYIIDNDGYIDEEYFGGEINEFIDNQIKQLKEGN